MSLHLMSFVYGYASLFPISSHVLHPHASFPSLPVCRMETGSKVNVNKELGLPNSD